ncbi:MAG: glycosyltransferase family 4 protein [Candidatus Omnitrophica bacterium]|nr:glycosyltransferase family 4 protein [Candidatus Omnitrophota bacterium]
MKVIILSTGVFKRQYGQQRYELSFLHTLFFLYPEVFFRVILLNDDEITADFHQLKNIKFITCAKKIRLFSKIKFILSSLFYSLKDKPNFLICSHINLTDIVFFLHKLLHVPYIILTHGTDAWNIKGFFKKKALIFSKMIISVSNYTASKIIEQIPQVKEKIFILNNCVDTDKFFPKEKPLHLIEKYNLSGFNIMLTVARFDTYDRDKGCDKVIMCLPKILKVIPNLKYILVGEGSDIERIKNLVSELNLKDYVILTGYIDDDMLPDYYNLSDLFIMPSKQEGFGRVFLEALACGKPVIAGNKDGSKEALLDGKLGILVDPDNLDEIMQGIISVFNKDINNRLLDSRYLRGKVLERFSLVHFESELKNLISNFLS